MTASWESIFQFSEQLGNRLLAKNLKLSTAESCTGGGIGYAITQIPGSSQWYQGGIIAYSNVVKADQLSVDTPLIDTHGAVSIKVVAAMATGAAQHFQTDIAVATSGVAGPDGGSQDKPVGTVCFGWVVHGDVHSESKYFSGDRESVRMQSIEYALAGLLNLL